MDEGRMALQEEHSVEMRPRTDVLTLLRPVPLTRRDGREPIPCKASRPICPSMHTCVM